MKFQKFVDDMNKELIPFWNVRPIALQLGVNAPVLLFVGNDTLTQVCTLPIAFYLQTESHDATPRRATVIRYM